MKNISLRECVPVASYKVNWLFHVAFWHVRNLLLSNSAPEKKYLKNLFLSSFLHMINSLQKQENLTTVFQKDDSRT